MTINSVTGTTGTNHRDGGPVPSERQERDTHTCKGVSPSQSVNPDDTHSSAIPSRSQWIQTTTPTPQAHERGSGRSADQRPTIGPPIMVTVEDAAALLGLCRAMVYRLMDTGQLRYKRIGRARRIPRAELERFAMDDLAGGWAMQPDTKLGDHRKTLENTGKFDTYSQSTAIATNGAHA
jgi:excisionase family DNA binding protein